MAQLFQHRAGQRVVQGGGNHRATAHRLSPDLHRGDVHPALAEQRADGPYPPRLVAVRDERSFPAMSSETAWPSIAVIRPRPPSSRLPTTLCAWRVSSSSPFAITRSSIASGASPRACE